MINYSNIIEVFYRQEMVLNTNIESSRSKSPLKPQKLIDYIRQTRNMDYFNIRPDFYPFSKEDFYKAHLKSYVDGFFAGDPNYTSEINIDWSEQMCESIRWTNSSLYSAIINSIENPAQISLSPTSGFHHATPQIGKDFCCFSGQVIASVKIYEQFNLSGCYIDLDAHYGNSIEDSRKYVQNLDKAIPKGFNINPSGEGECYIKSLKSSLEKLKKAILSGKIHYVVFCHGADSHKDDDLGCGSLSTEQWLLCSKLVYDMMEQVSLILKKPLPFILTLFGGYRQDNYDFVLDLHLRSILNTQKTSVAVV